MTSCSVRDLRVAYGTAEVVAGVSLDVPAGSWVALIGPNGAGKSTLLKAIAGLVPYAGSVLLDGTPADSYGRRDLSRAVGFVPQRPTIPEAMSVVDYVLMGRTPYIPYLSIESAHDLEVVREVIGTLELTHLSARPLGSLSGGEAQRVVLARALAQEAPLLLLDEPTAALDIGHQQQVLELVDVLRHERGLTVLSAMHDLTQASQFADALVLLNRGHAVAAGSPTEVLTEGAIREHYGASVRIVVEGSGVTVIPVRSSEDRSMDVSP